MSVFSLITICAIAFVVGYAIGRTRSRDRLPVEVYDDKGRRVL